jgi:hypothetical protein
VASTFYEMMSHRASGDFSEEQHAVAPFPDVERRRLAGSLGEVSKFGPDGSLEFFANPSQLTDRPTSNAL